MTCEAKPPNVRSWKSFVAREAESGPQVSAGWRSETVRRVHRPIVPLNPDPASVQAVAVDAPHRALIVDPQPEEMTAAARALTEVGCRPNVVSTFAEARDRLASSTDLSLFITAVRLREFNGMHLALRVRALFPRARIVLADRSFDPVIEREALKVGAEYFLKPIDWTAIAAALAASGSRNLHGGMRRWHRKRLWGELLAIVGGRAMRVLDVSIGGVRLQVPRDVGERLPAALEVGIPQIEVALRVHPIWARCSPGERTCECGGEMALDDRSMDRWQDYVDAL